MNRTFVKRTANLWTSSGYGVITLTVVATGPTHVRPTDPNGFILSRAQWDEIKDAVDSYYRWTLNEDIAVANEGNARDIERERQEESKPAVVAPSARSGYVYVIRSAQGHYKIGKTIEWKARRRAFDIRLPFDVETIAVYGTGDMSGLEGTLHAHFAPKRIRGEWFALDAADLDFITDTAKHFFPAPEAAS